MASPIEDAMLTALGRAAPRWFLLDQSDSLVLHWRDDRYIFVQRNRPLLTYRVDILLAPGLPAARFGLAIECDGHEFHDRTKQQAAYDRARDRELLLQDITTIRFTGSEIFHSPERCANEALKIFDRLLERALASASGVREELPLSAVGG